ncbi:MAG: hypothetical protein WC734_02300 [Patescibacteria group bacterium]|jgi:hypothetical protein
MTISSLKTSHRKRGKLIVSLLLMFACSALLVWGLFGLTKRVSKSAPLSSYGKESVSGSLREGYYGGTSTAETYDQNISSRAI